MHQLEAHSHLMIFKKINDWFDYKKNENILKNISCRLIISNEPLLDDHSLLYVFNEKIIKPQVFENHNIIGFSSRFSFIDSQYSNSIKCIKYHLNHLIIEKDCGDQDINFKWINALCASKSDTPENYNKWNNFFEFGKYAYEVHLRMYRTLETKTDWQEHYECLVHFFENLQEKRQGITSIHYQTWCGRYYLNNSGVVRRSAACSYMAKRGDKNFDKLIKFQVHEEFINWKAIKNIEENSESYVILANKNFHDKMEAFISETGVPLGVCIPHSSRTNNQDHQYRLYLLLHKELLQKTVNDKNYLEAYLLQIRKLKPQLDNLKQKNLSISLSEYIKFISNVWNQN